MLDIVVLLDEVLQNTPGLEEADLLPVAGEGICQGGDAAVGVDFEEPGLLLGVLRDVDLVDFVGEAELLEGDGDFDSVGGLVGVEGDVGGFGAGRHAGICSIGVFGQISDLKGSAHARLFNVA